MLVARETVNLLLRFDLFRNAEIGQTQITSAVKYQIQWFNILVHNILFVDVFERLYQASNEKFALLFGKLLLHILLSPELLLEIAAGH